MRFVFVRHGRAEKTGKRPLTAEGREASAMAAAWLGEQGVSIRRVGSTDELRACQTADIVAAALSVERAIRPGHVNTVALWDALVAELGEDAVFVGHHPTQGLLASKFGAPRLHKDVRNAVFVMERTDGPWQCIASWPGSDR